MIKIKTLVAVLLAASLSLSLNALNVDWVEDSLTAFHVEVSGSGTMSDHTETSPSGTWSIEVIMYEIAPIAAETALITGRNLPAPWPEIATDVLANTFRSLEDFPAQSSFTVSTGETFYGWGEIAPGATAHPSTWDWKFIGMSETAAAYQAMNKPMTVPDSGSSSLLLALGIIGLAFAKRNSFLNRR
ncbi:VPDSG-CTERM sorting domain-containing protein [Pelagicoccus sp. SDUM812002]|uniref:VPDSG-CTERM sorting domain-containing protein n=1 Tax=Pelagicoccus sp. SDUM812002 TaxID=3041266 RepID=UPI00280D5E7D|nr:VPDSG-CTERM sorting domain-containing protein [Pelagicoccus sp. SDUM812002]MDQ8187159.1 VPDSG-CTERM sorting domain-containing protein [Pelagicoccus sp. SDUM812002]